MWSAADESAPYNNLSWIFSNLKLQERTYAIIGDGYSYLERELTRNSDRKFVFLLAILSAVFGSFITMLITNSMG